MHVIIMILTSILEAHEQWLRLTAAIYYYLPKVYSNILHGSAKLPVSPATLYAKLNKHHGATLKSLLKKQNITQEQYDLILPANKKTDIENFDFQTFLHVIHYCTKLKPQGGWTQARNIKSSDQSKAAFLIELGEFISEHIMPVEPITIEHFEDDWEHLMDIFVHLKLNRKDIEYMHYSSFSNKEIPTQYMSAILKAQLEFIGFTEKRNELMIQNLQVEDEDDENIVDIISLLNENKEAKSLLKEIKNIEIEKEPQYFFTRLEDCDKMLKELNNNILFLNKVKKIDSEPFSYNMKGIGGNDDYSTSEKLKMVTHKLKATHTYNFNNMKRQTSTKTPFTNVELISYSNMNAYNTNNSRLDHKKNHVIYHEKQVSIESIFNDTNHVILRGSHGAGKTYIVNRILEQWIQGHFDSSIKYVFVLNYKDVKNIMNENLEYILSLLYPQIFTDVELDDILSQPNEMLLLLDGWGEMYYNRNVTDNDKDHHYYKKEHDIKEWFLENICVANHLETLKVLVTATPESCDLIFESFSWEFTIVDVLGFSRENIMKFTTEYMTTQNSQTTELINCLYGHYNTLRSILETPTHLNTYCFIYKNIRNIDQIVVTLTEIYLWKLLAQLYINHQQENNNLKEQELNTQFVQNNIIVTTVIELAEIAFENSLAERTNKQTKRNEIFNQDPILKDFLTAIYLFVSNKDPALIKEDKTIKACLSFVAGLNHLANKHKISSVTDTFVKSLNVQHNPKFIDNLFETYIQPSMKHPEINLNNEFISFLHSYNEYQSYLVNDKRYLSLKLHIKLHNLTSYDVDCLVYFLNHENYQFNIRSLDIHTLKAITTTQMQELALHLFSIPIIKIDIKSFTKASSIFCDILERHHEKTKFVVNLTEVHLMQKNTYEETYYDKLSLKWILYMYSFNLVLNVENSALYINKLYKTLQPKKDRPMFLRKLKLTLNQLNNRILDAFTSLITSSIKLHELELEMQNNTKGCSMLYPNHSNYEKQKSHKEAEDSTLNVAITTGLLDILQNDKSNNFYRLLIQYPFCRYEFLLNKLEKQITFVKERNDGNFVDIDMMKL